VLASFKRPEHAKLADYLQAIERRGQQLRKNFGENFFGPRNLRWEMSNYKTLRFRGIDLESDLEDDKPYSWGS
jgi:hypothetical protein